MRSSARQHGFSLLETLLAVSTLAIGMVFVGGTFLTGIYLATISTERTIGTVAVDEALAKIRIYGLDPNIPVDECTPYTELVEIPSSEFHYPSTDANDANAVSQYAWTALCRRLDSDSRLVQVTVLVSRLSGTGTRYWVRDPNSGEDELEQVELPHAVRVNVVQGNDDEDDELTIEDAVTSDDTDEETFVNDGATIIDTKTGSIYRVLERYMDPSDRIRLDRRWEGDSLATPDGGWVWVIPKPATGGRAPLVAVYQEVVRF
jgi:type II secretory pathway pseudopilin PulG